MMCDSCQEIAELSNIEIEKFFQDLLKKQIRSSQDGLSDQEMKNYICRLLLGFSPTAIAHQDLMEKNTTRDKKSIEARASLLRKKMSENYKPYILQIIDEKDTVFYQKYINNNQTTGKKQIDNFNATVLLNFLRKHYFKVKNIDFHKEITIFVSEKEIIKGSQLSKILMFYKELKKLNQEIDINLEHLVFLENNDE